MPPSEATDVQVLALIRASLATWQIGATVATKADGSWLVTIDGGSPIRVCRAPPSIPFRWMILAPSGRERPASSVTGLLRVLRSTLDPAWRSGRARVVSLTLPAVSSAAPQQEPSPLPRGASLEVEEEPSGPHSQHLHPTPNPSPSRGGEEETVQQSQRNGRSRIATEQLPHDDSPPPRGEGLGVGGQSLPLRRRLHPIPQPLSVEGRGDISASFAEGPRGAAMIPVTVLTGFLGSGKTTLLARLLRSPTFARTAVIINEFGEVGIDHDLVAAAEESFVTLETGCICCMVRGDLEATLADLVARRAMGSLPAFERVVIETSGLADPAPVLNAIMAETGRGAGIALEGVVTTVDAVTGLQTLKRETQSVRQVAVADRLIVTKTDLAPEGLGPEFDNHLRALNPRAKLLSAIQGEIAASALVGDGQSDSIPAFLAAPAAASLTGHDADIACATLRQRKPIPALALPLFLEALADHVGSDLLRLKAIVHVTECPAQPAVLHGVQHLFHEPQWLETWPSKDRSTRIVLLGRGISQLWIEALLSAIVAEVDELADTGLGS